MLVRKAASGCPAWREALTNTQIWQTTAYVASISHLSIKTVNVVGGAR
jgi:hypothetical protein